MGPIRIPLNQMCPVYAITIYTALIENQKRNIDKSRRAYMVGKSTILLQVIHRERKNESEQARFVM